MCKILVSNISVKCSHADNNIEYFIYGIAPLHVNVIIAAFFDGNSSGQLTSRLTNDVGFMVSPIQSMLGTLISNTILLLGGIVLCFLTSWRLSILAFTTIGPIVHVTQIYAKWSQGLNRRIYAALGAANGAYSFFVWLAI